MRYLAAASVLLATVALVSTGSAQQSPAASLPPGRYADVPGARLWYVDTGGSGEAVVLLHAMTGTHESWSPQLPVLAAAGFRVIAYDRRGSGKSQADPSTGPQPGTTGDDLQALADHLKLSRFHLVGVAAGGFAALDYAAWYGERLRSLVVGASTGSFAEPAMRELSERIAFPNFRQLPAQFRELGPSYRAENPEGARRWVEIEEHSLQPGVSLPPTKSPNTFSKVAAIKVRTLVMAADSDLLAPPSLMKVWARHVPGAQWTTIADAGHAISWERPQPFNTALIQFLRGKRFDAVPQP
jgi:pimeloyl-ACP methyl ester carboxylesterase